MKGEGRKWEEGWKGRREEGGEEVGGGNEEKEREMER